MIETTLNPELSEQFETDLLSELSRCKTVTMEQDTYLGVAGTAIRYAPIVLSGSIKVTRADNSGKEILMYHINPGESCIISITSSLKRNLCLH